MGCSTHGYSAAPRRVAPDSLLHPDLAVAGDDLQIEKDSCDVFLATGLGGELSRRDIDRVVVAGLETEYCGDTTCRRALSEWFEVVIAADAHTTHDTPDLSAAQLIGHHNRVLDKLTADSRRITVMATADVNFG